MKALLYACTTAADLGRTVLDEKLPELRRYAALKEWPVVGEFTDSIPTGIGKRQGFDAMCAELAAGKADVVVANSIADICWDLGIGLLRLQQLGVGSGVWLVCIRNSFDATTPAGALRLLDSMALIAEHRRDRAQTRQQIGIIRSRSRECGLTLAGRPRVILSPMELKDLWEVQGLSQPEILRKLDAAGARVSKGTLARAILNGVEAGSLDPAARAIAMEKRGGLNRGGRHPIPVEISEEELRRRWEGGQSISRIQKALAVGGRPAPASRIRALIAEGLKAGKLDPAAREESRRRSEHWDAA